MIRATNASRSTGISRGIAGVAILLAGCGGFTATFGPRTGQAPVITRFELRPDPLNPRKGPYEFVAFASGQGDLTFFWGATGGVVSVASESVASASGPVPSYTAWQPPAAMGYYQVGVTVHDSLGAGPSRSVRFVVDLSGARPVGDGPIAWPGERSLFDPTRTL